MASSRPATSPSDVSISKGLIQEKAGSTEPSTSPKSTLASATTAKITSATNSMPSGKYWDLADTSMPT